MRERLAIVANPIHKECYHGTYWRDLRGLRNLSVVGDLRAFGRTEYAERPYLSAVSTLQSVGHMDARSSGSNRLIADDDLGPPSAGGVVFNKAPITLS
jgi:hypothetical protein